MTKSTQTILITGATGNIGRELAKRLSAQNIPFRAMVRSSKSAEELSGLQGAELVHGDFNEAKSISDALEGVHRAFLLTSLQEFKTRQACDLTRLIILHATTRLHFPSQN
jgi:uncharacterized protein YbjT (DUF2867 family)